MLNDYNADKASYKLLKDNLAKDIAKAKDDYNDLVALNPDFANPFMLELAIRALKDIYFVQITPLMTELAQNWIDAYKDCCCTTSPTWFSAWLAAIRVNLKKELGTTGCDFIKKNFETFAWCDDKRTLINPTIKDEYFFVILEVDMIEQLFDEPGDSNGHHHLFNKNKRAGDNDLPEIDPEDLKDGCLTGKLKGPDEVTGNIQLFHYSYSIPVYSGIFLDFEFGAGLNYGINFTVDFCFLSMQANAVGGPYGAVTASVSAAISFFIIRAGVEVQATLLATQIPATASIKLLEWPLEMCFSLDRITNPLTVTVSVFFQIRWKIVFLGLDWGDKMKYPIGGWGLDPIIDNILTTCQDKEAPVPKGITKLIELDEDELLLGVHVDMANNKRGSVLLHARGAGSVTIKDSNQGTFDYRPVAFSDKAVSLTWLI